MVRLRAATYMRKRFAGYWNLRNVIERVAEPLLDAQTKGSATLQAG